MKNLDKFSSLLEDLGRTLDAEISLDHNDVCLLTWQEKIDVQLEYEGQNDRVLISSFLIEPPPGKYLESLLYKCLVLNCFLPQIGILSYFEQSNQIVFFTYMRATRVTGEKFFNVFEEFSELAYMIKTSMDTGSEFIL